MGLQLNQSKVLVWAEMSWIPAPSSGLALGEKKFDLKNKDKKK
jgi:hypothetical protein